MCPNLSTSSCCTRPQHTQAHTSSTGGGSNDNTEQPSCAQAAQAALRCTQALSVTISSGRSDYKLLLSLLRIYRLPRPTAFGAGAALPAGALACLAFSAFTFLARSFTSRMALSRLAWRNCGAGSTTQDRAHQE